MRVRHVLPLLLAGLLALPAAAIDLPAEVLAAPAPGSSTLRILTPTQLELELVVAKDRDPARPPQWDYVDETTGTLTWHMPAASTFTVRAGTGAGTSTIAVQAVGFKRRPASAGQTTRDLRLRSSIFLTLASALPDGADVDVTSSATFWPAGLHFTGTASAQRLNPALHVSQAGYQTALPKKAYVGYYLGNRGELPIPTQAGFDVVQAGTLTSVFHGALVQHADVGLPTTATTYQQVYEADFSALQSAGEYQLSVPGMGVSLPFRVGDGVAGVWARTYALGLYHQRCGTAQVLPYTRFVDGLDHVAPADVPVPMSAFPRTWSLIAGATADSWRFLQTAPVLRDQASQLYPFVRTGQVDVSGGHHDAGDYSKYTTDAAQLVHALVFAADALPGAGALDNLGLPESGDGRSDLLQEAKIEADFLARMQDDDGGFSFLVYPEYRAYEADSLPTPGDPQAVWPKNTSATAAAVAALAEIASSPRFRAQYPTAAAGYLTRARSGWQFLTNAIARYGKLGAYQKLHNYGNVFQHDDELAWAASALFAATGERAYHDQLRAWLPDPSSPSVRKWTWVRLFEGYGAALRTYAFAAITGRRASTELDPAYLYLAQREVVLAADDVLTRAQKNAYGTSFPLENKSAGTAGYYFAASEAFDLVAGYQLLPKADYLAALAGNLAFEGGTNPANMPFLTGIGWKRQRQIVSQFASNDERVLPPTGLPIGGITAGFGAAALYTTATNQNELSLLTFPPDNAASGRFAVYDRFSDVASVNDEATVVTQGRGLAAAAFLFANSGLQDQPWNAGQLSITGVPASVPVGGQLTATLDAPGFDLSQAQIVWEASEQEPAYGSSYTITARARRTQWLEAEVLLPDGRRLFASTQFNAYDTVTTPIESYQATPLDTNPDVVAWYPLDRGYSDARGTLPSLVPAGNARLDSSAFVWPNRAGGSALRVANLGDAARVQVPNAAFFTAGQTTAVSLEAMIYVSSFKAYGRDNVNLVSLRKGWNSQLRLYEDKWLGVQAHGGSVVLLNRAQLAPLLTLKTWHHLKIVVDATGYTLLLDGRTVATGASREFANYASGTSTLEIGNFDGWVDEVVLKNVRAADRTPPVIRLNGASPMTVRVGNLYVEPGAAVSDDRSGASAATVTGTVDTSRIGTYTLTYDATDAAGNRAVPVTRTVYVIDGVTPILALNGPATMQLERFLDTYVEQGATAIDANGNSLPVTITGAVNTSVPGVYTLRYDARDANGITAVTATRTVTVTSTAIGIYTFDSGMQDVTGRLPSLVAEGAAARSNGALRVSHLGDRATVSVPNALLYVDGQTRSISIEAKIFVNDYLGYSLTNANVVRLQRGWDAQLALVQDKWAHIPQIVGGVTRLLTPAALSSVLTPGDWHRLAITLDRTGYTVTIDGVELLRSLDSTALPLWKASSGGSALEVGNFDGWIDNVVVRSVK